MTAKAISDRAERPTRQESPSHLYSVGQAVRLTSRLLVRPAKTAGIYHVTATLPPKGETPQYRVRNDEEPHERVVTQDSLEPIDMTDAHDNAALIERTFGHGQRTETQQSRDQKVEAGEGSGKA